MLYRCHIDNLAKICFSGYALIFIGYNDGLKYIYNEEGAIPITLLFIFFTNSLDIGQI